MIYSDYYVTKTVSRRNIRALRLATVVLSTTKAGVTAIFTKEIARTLDLN